MERMVGKHLAHHGVKGMKWGVRREKLSRAFDQSIKVGKDKSPISPAEKTFKESGKVLEESMKITNSMSRIRGMKNKKTNPTSHMSDKELRDAINRLDMERRYASLTSEDTSKGFAYTTEILGIVGSVVGIAGSVAGIATAIYTLNNK